MKPLRVEERREQRRLFQPYPPAQAYQLLWLIQNPKYCSLWQCTVVCTRKQPLRNKNTSWSVNARSQRLRACRRGLCSLICTNMQPGWGYGTPALGLPTNTYKTASTTYRGPSMTIQIHDYSLFRTSGIKLSLTWARLGDPACYHSLTMQTKVLRYN